MGTQKVGRLAGAALIHADIPKASKDESPTAEECQQQVDRILHSATFRNALTLQQLFQYLASKAISGSADSLKEYSIGVEAFGRPHDFDPKTDTIVRVQIHRLRQKLKEYYDNEGSRDTIAIGIPKGHYLPSFEVAAFSGADLKVIPAPSPEGSFHGALSYAGDRAQNGATRAGRRFGRILSSRTAIAVAAVALVFAAGFLVGTRQIRSHIRTDAASANAELAADKSADPVKAFWMSFLGNDSAPVIAYPDAVFLLDDSNDLFRFRQGAIDNRGAVVDPHLARRFASSPSLVAQAGQLYYENGYTGTGELQAIAMVTGLLGQMGVKATIKPSRDVTPDDFKQHDVILLGSPFQNIAVAQLLSAGDFTFENPDARREQWRAQILNARPRTNENSTYHTERDPVTHVLKTDYSILSIQPGVVPGRYIALLGGLDTKGTEGATMFATSKPGIEELLKALAASDNPSARSELSVFQALVRVRLDKGYQVMDADLVAVHRLRARNAGGGGGTTP